MNLVFTFHLSYKDIKIAIWNYYYYYLVSLRTQRAGFLGESGMNLFLVKIKINNFL